MPGLFEKTYGRYAASQGNELLSSHQKSLLSDPSLVEDYKDIMRQLPNGGEVAKGDDELSTNASVVLSRPANSEKKLGTALGAGSVNGTSQVLHRKPFREGQLGMEWRRVDEGVRSRVAATQEESAYAEDASPRQSDEAVVHTEAVEPDDGEERDYQERSSEYDDEDYGYSDSDFEDTLQSGLVEMEREKYHSHHKQLESRATVSRITHVGKNAVESFFKPDSATDLSESDSEDDLDDIDDRSSSSDDEIMVIRNDLAEEDAGNIDDEIDEDFPPLPPPREMDPGKLYALYPFQGPDPSHCQLEQDQSCVLLNDQDSYWWLVKRCSDGKIGFAPAEILETFPERLARLNCWKNENMSSHSISSAEQCTTEQKSPSERTQNKSCDDGNKSVSFNDVVSYAERYLQVSEDEDEGAINNSDDEGHTMSVHIDEIHHTQLNDHHLLEEEVGENISDAAFTTANMVPLDVKKVRKPPQQNQSRILNDMGYIQVIKEKGKQSLKLPKNLDSAEEHVTRDDDLKQIFQAPTIPFLHNRNNDIPNSNSFNSISTIGEYSPSSSEYTNDSPQFDNDGRFTKEIEKDTIPTARAIQDISRLVTTATDDTLNSVSEDGRDPLSPSPTSTPQVSTFSGSVTEFERKMVKGESDESILDSHKTENKPFSMVNSQTFDRYAHHPVVQELYSPVFDKIDDLLQKLERLTTASTK